jgi:hypothetical protein
VLRILQPPAWQDGMVPRTRNKAAAKYTILIGDAIKTRILLLNYGRITYTKAQPTSYIYTIRRHALLIFYIYYYILRWMRYRYLLPCAKINIYPLFTRSEIWISLGWGYINYIIIYMDILGTEIYRYLISWTDLLGSGKRYGVYENNPPRKLE